MHESLCEFLGTELTGDWFDNLVDKLVEDMDVDEPTVYDSVRYLAGDVLTRPKAYILAWHLAGNIDRLRDGIAVPQWYVQTEEEWVPVQVLSWQPDKSPRGKPMNMYGLRVLAGTPCPVRVTACWPVGFTKMIARQIGFSNRRGKVPFQHPSEFVQLRFRILADPARSKPGQLGFWEVAGGSGMNKWNREIMEMRSRINFVCPEGYTHPCYRCPVGYDICEAAVHRETLYAEE